MGFNSGFKGLRAEGRKRNKNKCRVNRLRIRGTHNENVRKGKTKEKYKKICIAGFISAFVLLLFDTLSLTVGRKEDDKQNTYIYRSVFNIIFL